jgi:hypothetical protein
MRDYIISAELRERKVLNVVKYATAANQVPIIVENIITKEKIEYVSIREAGRVLGLNNTSLSYALRNNSILKKLYIITKK